MRFIDLYSDTKSKPTDGMRRFMCEAEVGDEQKGEDPTVNRLCGMVAGLLGKEDALFLPSGTMCNEIAIAVHCRPGEEIICDRTAHIVNYEAGGPAALAGAMVRGLDGDGGIFTGDDVRRACRDESRYAPRSRLVVVEQTTNLGGGRVWPLAGIRDVAAAARSRSLALHMDGARLFNASVASGVPVADFAEPFDSAWIDLTKGLGAPVGAVLAGSAGFVREAWRLKQRWGGAMRQAGIIAAAGVYAIENHVDRLSEDHANARRLAEGLATLPGVVVDAGAIETNIVFFDVSETRWTAAEVVAAAKEQGVGLGAFGPSTIRAVTHIGIGTQDIDDALSALEGIFAGKVPGDPAHRVTAAG